MFISDSGNKSIPIIPITCKKLIQQFYFPVEIYEIQNSKLCN